MTVPLINEKSKSDMNTFYKSFFASSILFLVFAPCAFGMWFYIFVYSLHNVWENLNSPYGEMLGWAMMLFALVTSLVLYFLMLAKLLAWLVPVKDKDLKLYLFLSGFVTLALAVIALSVFINSLCFMW